MIASLIYNLLLLIFSPILLLWFLWRVAVSKKSKESWRHNLGALPNLADRPADSKLVWIHAASVGEEVSSLPVQEALKREFPECTILVTTVTQTGNYVARKSPYADAVGYLPFDYPFFVHRALNRVHPDVFVLVEAELWPNLLACAKRLLIPCVLINGRMSDRSMSRLRWWGWVMKWAVSNLDRCLMQTEVDADRIRIMGARSETVLVAGNTKFDENMVNLSPEAVGELRKCLGLREGVRVFVAGSTNPGEDEIVIDAFSCIREVFPELRMIIAPRQIERGDEIRSMVEQRKLVCALRTEPDSYKGDWDVLVLNSFGELAKIYAVGEIAFVGGSLIPKGGHSIIQPILQEKPVMFGPYTFKTRDVAQTAISSGVGFEVSDAKSLADCAIDLLGSDGVLADIAKKCRDLSEANRGASVRCANVILGTMVDSGVS